MVEYVNRKNTYSMKWDSLQETFGADNLLPLWVADMDFRVDEHIVEAMQRYLDTGVFGYYRVPDSYYQSFINWEREQHGLDVQRDWIRFSPGVVVGFHLAVQVLSNPGDAVMINTPVYFPFMHAAEANDRILVKAPLRVHDCVYDIDFEDFERQIVEHNVKVYVLCSPHNPVGRVWTRKELQRMLDICRAHGVAIVSDEIHQDLVFEPHVHIPTLTLAHDDDKIILLTAASKTFNIAGLQNSFAVIPNEEIRAQWDKITNGLRLRDGNVLGYVAVEAAYTYGKSWLDDIKRIVWENYTLLKDTCAKQLVNAKLSPLEGTYLAWLDLSEYLAPGEVQSFLQDTCKLAFDYGDWFGNESDSSFIRINLATSRENIEEMLRRIIDNLA